MALMLGMPDTDFLKEEACGCVYDLREWWSATQRGLPPPVIRPIRAGNEQRECLNPVGLHKLNSIAPVGDNDMLDMMCNSGFDMKVNPDHNMLLLVPNAKQFYDHIEHSVKKVKEESAMGILQGPFPGLPFVPAQTVENSYVVQKSKERRIGRGDAPYNFLWNDKDCSINANIDLGDFPEMRLPSVMTFASNMAKAQTLYEETHDERHYLVALNFFEDLSIRFRVAGHEQLLDVLRHAFSLVPESVERKRALMRGVDDINSLRTGDFHALRHISTNSVSHSAGPYRSWSTETISCDAI
jgi:hypothetical protein